MVPAGSVAQNRLRQKIILLEDSLAKVAAARKRLKDSVDIAKQEVSNAISREVDVIHNREQYLISQLDAVLAVKEELLSEQQDHLNERLGACRQGLECLTASLADLKKTGSESDAVEQQINDLLESIAHLELSPKEATNVHLELNPYSMRRAVQSFGRIHFGKMEAKNTQSLPSGDFEDYEDEQHQVLFKPLQHHTAMVRIGRPKLSNNLDDWLLKEALTTQPGSLGSDGNGGQSSPHRHISSWLHQIKGQVESEPILFEDFEIVRKSGQSGSQRTSESIEILDNSSLDWDSLFTGYFHQVLSSPSGRWLAGNKECPPTEFSRDPYFVDIWQRNNMEWLVQPSTSKSGGSMDYELEDLADKLEQVCRANEVCKTCDECLFPENCMDVAQRKWLMVKGSEYGGGGGNRVDLLPSVWRNSSLEDWLYRPDDSPKPADSSPDEPGLRKHMEKCLGWQKVSEEAEALCWLQKSSPYQQQKDDRSLDYLNQLFPVFGQKQDSSFWLAQDLPDAAWEDKDVEMI